MQIQFPILNLYNPTWASRSHKSYRCFSHVEHLLMLHTHHSNKVIMIQCPNCSCTAPLTGPHFASFSGASVSPYLKSLGHSRLISVISMQGLEMIWLLQPQVQRLSPSFDLQNTAASCHFQDNSTALLRLAAWSLACGPSQILLGSLKT